MWFQRKIEKISWRDKITNEEALKSGKKEEKKRWKLLLED